MDKFELKRQAYTAKIAEYVLHHGISGASLRKMADAAATSDRMLMHYFKDKSDIETRVLTAISEELMDLLNENLTLRLGFRDFLLFIREAIKDQRIKPYLNLWFEVTHLATGNKEPYVTVMQEIGKSFEQWIDRVYAPTPDENGPQLAALLFVITEGLVVLDRIEMPDRMVRAIDGMIGLYDQAKGIQQ